MMKILIDNFCDFVCQPCIALPILFLGVALVGVLLWAIWFPEDCEEFAAMLFEKEKKVYKCKKHNNGYQKMLDDTDVAEMMRLVEEAWK